MKNSVALPSPASNDNLRDPFGGSPENWSLAETIRDPDYEAWLDELAAEADANEYGVAMTLREIDDLPW